MSNNINPFKRPDQVGDLIGPNHPGFRFNVDVDRNTDPDFGVPQGSIPEGARFDPFIVPNNFPGTANPDSPINNIKFI